eukprot:UN00992
MVKSPGRQMVPTTLGIVLVHGYNLIDTDLVDATIRSALEQNLTQIAAGKARYTEVVDFILHIFLNKYNYFVKK